MSVNLLTEHHLEFLSLIGGCSGSSESALSLVKMPHCWKSCVAAQIVVGCQLGVPISYYNISSGQLY